MRTAVCMLLGLSIASASFSRAPLAAAREKQKSPAVTARVPVRVIDIADGRAYLSPGSERQVQTGDSVLIAGKRYTVVANSRKYAAIAITSSSVRLGQAGVALVSASRPKDFAARMPPRPLDAFRGQWPEAKLPATLQSPRYVPLGDTRRAGRNRVWIAVDASRLVPLSGSATAISRERLRARLHLEPLQTVPLTFDADAQITAWQAADLEARRGQPSRSIFTIRQLELGYRGAAVDGSVGRLRYAARTLGMLDGARVRAPLGEHLSLGAFGGALPNALDQTFSTEASRFGAEAIWQDMDATWRPSASLTLHASRFQGSFDERRVSGLFDAFPRFGRLGSHVELDIFDDDNPWGASRVELTALGLDATARAGALRLGGAIDYRRPERSRWLAQSLPPGWFCVASPQPGSPPLEPCRGGDARVFGALNASYEQLHWALDTGVNAVGTQRAEAEQLSAFTGVRLMELWQRARLDTGLAFTRGSFVDSEAWNIGAGSRLFDDWVDIGARYRPQLTRYRASPTSFVQHGFGADIWLYTPADLDFSLSADITTGRDVDLLLVQGSATWRPRF